MERIYSLLGEKAFVFGIALTLALGSLGSLAQSNSSGTNAPSARITHPFNGQEFSPGGWRRIEIVAEAFHPDYTVREFEIFSGTNLIREIYVSWNLSPNEPTQMSFLWDAPVGTHTLTVRAAGMVSEPVSIIVDANARPTVSAKYMRGGTDPIPYADYSQGYFWIERTERIDESLTVFFDVSGTATERPPTPCTAR